MIGPWKGGQPCRLNA